MMYTSIKEDFDRVISNYYNIPNPKSERLFKDWEKNKSRFIEIFGNKLIYECPEPIQFELDEETKKEKLLHFILSVAEHWGYSDLADFLETQKHQGFFSNLVTEDYIYQDKKITKGTKLVKSFKYFIQDNDLLLTTIQNQASRIIQENKVEGKLCFSVHPLDYLTISENTSNWRSCHAMDGDYCAGNLGYMIDKSTIVCYLKSENDVQLSAFPKGMLWNNKKWRVLLFVSTNWNMIFAGKPYPFNSPTGMDLILKNLPFADSYTPWSDSYINSVKTSREKEITGIRVLNNRYVAVDSKLVSMDSLISSPKGSCNYNDLAYSSVYTKPLYSYREGSTIIYIPTTFSIGSPIYCLNCEEDMIQGINSNTSSICCSDCVEPDYEFFCVCCGIGLWEDDAYFIDGEAVCPGCLERHFVKCEGCDEYFPKDAINYYAKEDIYLCDHCLEEEE